MCDCEQASCSTLKHPKARKPHVCCECNSVILPGQIYELFKGIWDGHAYTFHTCDSCATVRNFYIETNITRYDCPPCYGQLWDDIKQTGEGTREDWIKWAHEGDSVT